jgi:hypothetical protein
MKTKSGGKSMTINLRKVYDKVRKPMPPATRVCADREKD